MKVHESKVRNTDSLLAAVSESERLKCLTPPANPKTTKTLERTKFIEGIRFNEQKKIQ
jgi:hypothetical protein